MVKTKHDQNFANGIAAQQQSPHKAVFTGVVDTSLRHELVEQPADQFRPVVCRRVSSTLGKLQAQQDNPFLVPITFNE